MQNVVTFWSDILGVVTDFLLAAPISYFVAIMILILIAGFIRSLIR